MAFRVTHSTGRFPKLVIDEAGLPHSALTLYACAVSPLYSPRTASTYIREIVDFASWAADDAVVVRQKWNLFGSPSEVRALLDFFLKTKLRCVVRVRQDKLGFETVRVEPTWQTGRQLNHLLAAMRSLYDVLRSKGIYHHPNPMEGDVAAELIAEERRRQIESITKDAKRSLMPAVSGVDPPVRKHGSAAYFRLNGSEWVPDIIDDPSMFERVMQAGIDGRWSLREIALARVLFDTGCRLHEACALTFGDWRHSQFQTQLLAINKGSRGRRVKRLFITDRTAIVLQRYVNEQRSFLDEKRRSLRDFQAMSLADIQEEPIFITRLKTPLMPDDFRRNFWSPVLNDAGIKFRPHQVRHWFVTMALNDINARSTSEEERQDLLLQLRELMAWKSDQIPTYDQAIRRYNLPELAQRIHSSIEKEGHGGSLSLGEKVKIRELKRIDADSERFLAEMTGRKAV